MLTVLQVWDHSVMARWQQAEPPEASGSDRAGISRLTSGLFLSMAYRKIEREACRQVAVIIGRHWTDNYGAPYGVLIA